MSGSASDHLQRLFHNLEGAAGGQRMLHFYFSPEQRRLVVRQLLRSLGPDAKLVLGCSREDAQFYRGIFQAATRPPVVTYVPVTADWHRSVCQLLEECFVPQGRKVVLLADFAALVGSGEIESIAQWLEGGLRDSQVTWITQFDGAAFSARLLSSPLRRTAWVLFDGFYCTPNERATRSCVDAGEYSRKPSVDMSAD